MTTFAFPSITPTTNTFELVANTRTFQSPLTNAVQTSSRKGSLWKASLQFSNLKGDDRQEMQAFLVKLNGQQHRFTLHDHSYTRRGAGGGTLSINGASQSGTALVRSEEHTSELQSRLHLVCRLLLGKKKHTSEPVTGKKRVTCAEWKKK